MMCFPCLNWVIFWSFELFIFCRILGFCWRALEKSKTDSHNLWWFTMVQSKNITLNKSKTTSRIAFHRWFLERVSKATKFTNIYSVSGWTFCGNCLYLEDCCINQCNSKWKIYSEKIISQHYFQMVQLPTMQSSMAIQNISTWRIVIAILDHRSTILDIWHNICC